MFGDDFAACSVDGDGTAHEQQHPCPGPGADDVVAPRPAEELLRSFGAGLSEALNFSVDDDPNRTELGPQDEDDGNEDQAEAGPGGGLASIPPVRSASLGE